MLRARTDTGVRPWEKEKEGSAPWSRDGTAVWGESTCYTVHSSEPEVEGGRKCTLV